MRYIKLAVTIAFFIFWVVLLQKEFAQVKLRLLNHFMPSSYEELLWVNGGGKEFDPKTLEKYSRYFQTLKWILPKHSEPYELLGVCYYYLGQDEKARKVLEKAVELNSNFFWSRYNLGVFYLKKQDYPRAAGHFKAALGVSPQETMAQIFQSKIYQDILRSNHLTAERLANQLRLGYQQAMIFLKLSSEGNTPPESFQNQLQLRMF